LCYQASNEIVALYETNRLRQVHDGAPAERTRNIPNGIDLPRLSKLRALRSEKIRRCFACWAGWCRSRM
jgi:hypothetical protein